VSAVEPVTVAALLGDGDADRGARALKRGLGQAKTGERALESAGGLSTVTFRLADERVTEALGGQLSTDVGRMVLDGWLKYRELVAAAERTRAAPGQPEDVVLAAHEIASTYRPSVDVLIDGSLVTTLTFELTVSVELRGVIAVVERGRLTAIRAGDVVAAARISLWDRQLAGGEHRCAVGKVVRLRDGVALVASAAASPGAAAQQWPTPAPPGTPPTATPTPTAPAPAPAPPAANGSHWWERVPQQSRAQPYQWPKPTAEPERPRRTGESAHHG
jgi:hypothetical protein